MSEVNQTLSDKERRLIAYVEQQWFLEGSLPTPETLCEKFNYRPKALKEVLESELVKKSFDARGIPTIEGRELTPDQISAINEILNFSDTRSERKKLADMGISAKTWAGWRNNPAFKEYMLQRTEAILGGAIPDAHMALVERVRAGDMGALKFYYEMSGRYTGQGNGLDPKALLNRVFEIISLHVKDPNVLTAIAGELLGLTNVDQGSSLNSIPPVAGQVVANRE